MAKTKKATEKKVSVKKAKEKKVSVKKAAKKAVKTEEAGEEKNISIDSFHKENSDFLLEVHGHTGSKKLSEEQKHDLELQKNYAREFAKSHGGK